MKAISILLAIALAAASSLAHAQAKWLTSYQQAAAESKKTGRPIMANFTGSDWCMWCHVLDKEVFSTKEFGKWAPSHVVLLTLDFPHKRKLPKELQAQNERLQKKYSIDGYPTIMLMNADGSLIGRMGYEAGGPKPWIAHANRLLGVKNGLKQVVFHRDEYPPIVKKELYAQHDLRGKKAPEFSFGEAVNGQLPDLKGKVVMIDFWATWCPPCRELIPEANGFAEKFKDDLVVIGVSNEDKKTLSAFLKKTPINYIVTSDPKQVMESKIGVTGIPHVLVITPDGIVRWQGFPGTAADPLTEEKLAQIIAASKHPGQLFS